MGLKFSKEKNFSEWYSEVITKSEFADYSAVSGCMVLRPLGYAVWERIVEETDKRLKKLGVKNTSFPMLIPERFLKKEAEHFAGFTPEVAWVTHAGDNELDERLAVRPTSEVIMYDSYSRWIRSWRDLPLMLNQWNSVFRMEFKDPFPFIRGREFLWNELHTALATEKEALEEGKKVIAAYTEVCEDYLAIAGIYGRKTDKEKFAGGVFSEKINYMLPNGKAVEGPCFHHDGQNFAKAFDITFLDKDEKKKYVYQSTYAISTRQLGILIATHSDNKGLILPPKIAPIQVVVIPIYDDKNRSKIIKAARNIKLKDIKVEIDERDEYSPGWKFNEWELKGVPLRIEIGPRDLAKKQVVLVRRDIPEKKIVLLSKVSIEVSKILDNIQKNLFEKAKKALKEDITETNNYTKFKEILEKKGGFLLSPWCGEQACEDSVKEETAAKILILAKDKVKGKCIYCGKPAKKIAYFAKSY